MLAYYKISLVDVPVLTYLWSQVW